MLPSRIPTLSQIACTAKSSGEMFIQEGRHEKCYYKSDYIFYSILENID